MELDEFHVLQWQAGAQHHGIAVTRTCVSRGTGEEGAAIPAGRKHDFLRAEAVQRAVIEFPRGDTSASAFLIHDEVERKIFDEEFGLFLDALTIQCVQHGVTGTVSRSTCPLDRALTKITCHAAECALVDLAFLCSREGHAPMLKLVNRSGRFTAKIFDGVLIAKPV